MGVKFRNLLCFLFVFFLMNFPIVEVSLGRIVVNFVKEGHSHFHSVGVNEISLASDHERTSGQELTCWSWLGNLFRVHPPGSWDNLCLPCLWSTNCENGGLLQCIERDSDIFAMTLYDCGSGSSVIWVHVKISWFHVSFDQKFILMGVFSRDDKVTFWRNEPSELFEPKNLSLWKVFAENFILLFLYFL
jgi:hypothetical protein